MERVASLKVFATAGALAAGAVALWLSAVSAGGAASATTTQGTTAQVTKVISWDTGAEGCTTDNAASFGELAPGASATSSVFQGCVSSNASWSVAAEGTQAMSNGTDTIANSNIKIRLTSAAPGANNTSTQACDAFTDDCHLGASRTLFTGANASNTGNPLRKFSYEYQLNMPADQAAGSYSGGQVTFTASN